MAMTYLGIVVCACLAATINARQQYGAVPRNSYSGLSDYDKQYADELYLPGGPRSSYGDKLTLDLSLDNDRDYNNYGGLPQRYNSRPKTYQRVEPVKERKLQSYPKPRPYTTEDMYADEAYSPARYEGLKEEPQEEYMKYEEPKPDYMKYQAREAKYTQRKPNRQTKQYDSERFFYGHPRLVKAPRKEVRKQQYSSRRRDNNVTPAGYPVLSKHYESPAPSQSRGFTAPPPPPDPCQHLDTGDYDLDDEFASILPKADIVCSFVKCAHGTAFLTQCGQGTRNDNYGHGFCNQRDYEGVCGPKPRSQPKKSLSVHNRQSRKRLYSRKDPCIEKNEGMYVLEREFKTHFPYTDNMCYFVKCANKKAFLNPCGPGTRNNDDGSGFCSVLDLEGYCGRTIYDKKPEKQARPSRKYREHNHGRY